MPSKSKSKSKKKTTAKSRSKAVSSNGKSQVKRSSKALTLGADDAYEEGGGSRGFLRLSKDELDNVFCIVHPDYLVVREHFLSVDDQPLDEKINRVVCGLHKFEDNQGDLVNAMGAPDDCSICIRSMNLFKEAKDGNEKDILVQRKKDLGHELKAGTAVLMLAIKGEADTKRLRGKKVVEPFFENKNVKYLSISKKAFDMFRDAFKSHNLTSNDAFGLPVNFKRKKGKRYMEVVGVDLFPDKKMKDVPKQVPDFSGFAEYDEAVAHEAAEIIDRELPALLSGRRRPSSKSKSKSKSKSRK
jgi:hypothetical protein